MTPLTIIEGDLNAKSDVDSGEYERIRPLKPGDCVLDLGAHVGYFAERAAKAVAPSGSVIAFEPHPRNFQELAARMTPYPRCMCCRFAAWDKDGEETFWNNPLNSGGHSLWRNGQHDAGFTVMCVDIGPWLRSVCFEPDFVKIDTEGAEAKIVQSILSAGFRPFFALECHGPDLYESCKRLLTACGYKMLPETCHAGICHAFLP